MEIRVLQRMEKSEIENIVKDCSEGMSMFEVCKKYDISEDQFYRIMRKYKGTYNDAKRRDIYTKKITRLEKKLKEREEEIKLLRSALKKS